MATVNVDNITVHKTPMSDYTTFYLTAQHRLQGVPKKRHLLSC